MILLVLVVLLWVAVLAPSVWRRFGERQGVGSIDHFHHQLQLLEHAGPKTVAPAYRLHTAFPGAAPLGSRRTIRSTRPARSWCCSGRPTNAAAADVDDGEGGHYERVGVLDRPEPVCLPEVGADLPAFRREQARRRCTMLLRCLCGVAISTALIGIWSRACTWLGCSPALAGLAALGLVALMAYAKELEAEQSAGAVHGGQPASVRRRRAVASTRRRPATPEPGTTTTSRCPGPPPAEHASALLRTPAPTRDGSGARLSWPAAGGVAQLVERYVRNVEAGGSSPFTSTRRNARSQA